LTQDTADANYVLLTVVVNGHNCAAATDGNDGNTTQRCELDMSDTWHPSM